MQATAGLTGDAAALARDHRALLGQLPATVQAFSLLELHRWADLFAAERRYQRTFLEVLHGLPDAELRDLGAAVASIERRAGIGRMNEEPRRFQDEAQARLRKARLLADWRAAIDRFFQAVTPAIDARLYPDASPRRVIVQLYPGDIAVQVDRLWRPFKDRGLRLTLDLQGGRASASFLQDLFGTTAAGGRPAMAAALPAMAGAEPPEAWLIEARETLHAAFEVDAAPEHPAWFTGLSYQRLLPYRDALMHALYQKIQSGVESPQAFAAYARSLTTAPPDGALTPAADVLRTFVRDVFLTGNGTLFVNNTFVEWAAVQALRRAQPRLLMVRYGVRDRLKPFSSLLLFSQPRESDRIPLIEDPLGSFIDAEELAYYVWVNAEKGAAYRGHTLYLFLAEGIDQMLAIRSDGRVQPAPAGPVTLADVGATAAAWLGGANPGQAGSVIDALRAPASGA
jgi:hypothetical protein